MADRFLEFALGEPCFAHERVQVLDQQREQFARARVRRAVHLAEHRSRNVVLRFDDHDFLRTEEVYFSLCGGRRRDCHRPGYHRGIRRRRTGSRG